jgi:hypothetical protein
MVRDMISRIRHTESEHHESLRPHLRGNEALYKALTTMIQSRIEGRAQLRLPSDPLQAYGSLARDKECQWLLGQLGFVYNGPIQEPAENSEQPDQ